MANIKDEKVKADVSNTPKECFVIMPISDPDGYEEGHFRRVYEDIFMPAIDKAGYKPFRADDNNAASMIHLEILNKLLECPIAICDLSSRNPNVLFELGIRQAFDLPVILVQEVGTQRIFDISSINTIDYRQERIYHQVIEDQQKIYQGIIDTMRDWKEGKSINSIIRLLSLRQPAQLKELENAKQDPAVQFIMEEISSLRSEFRNIKNLQNTEHVLKWGESEVIEGQIKNFMIDHAVVEMAKTNNQSIPSHILKGLIDKSQYFNKKASINPDIIGSFQVRLLAERYNDLKETAIDHNVSIKKSDEKVG